MTLTRYINVKTQFIGFHKYEAAPDVVAFLKANHRHVFKIQCTIEVTHDDRELEFFMVQNKLDMEIVPFIQLKPLGSCEMIAEDILKGLFHAYGKDRAYAVDVSEDGENSGGCTWSA